LKILCVLKTCLGRLHHHLAGESRRADLFRLWVPKDFLGGGSPTRISEGRLFERWHERLFLFSGRACGGNGTRRRTAAFTANSLLGRYLVLGSSKIRKVFLSPVNSAVGQKGVEGWDVAAKRKGLVPRQAGAIFVPLRVSFL